MALVDLIGPAHGTLDAAGPWALSPSAGMTIASANPRPGSGGYTVRVDVSSGAGRAVKQFNPTVNQIVVPFAWRPDFSGMAAGGFELPILHLYDNTDTHYVEVRVDGRKTSEAASQAIRLKAYSGGTTDTKTHPTVPVNGSWYIVELSLDLSTNPWAVTWRMKPHGGAWVNGDAISLAVATRQITYYLFGTNGTSTGYKYDLQDLLFATAQTAYLDDHYVLWTPAQQAATHNLDASPSSFFFEHDGATGVAITSADAISAGRIDDTPIGASSDRIYATGAPNAAQYLEYDFPNTSETPLAVRVVEAVQQDTSAGGSVYTSKVTDDGGTSLTTVQSALDPNTTVEAFKSKLITAKPSGGAWTAAALNALKYRWGFTADAAPVIRLNAVGLEVAYPYLSTPITQVFAMPWELVGAPVKTLGELPNTASVSRVWIGITAPTATDDAAAGVSVGDIWVYNQQVWWCVSAAAAAAVWKQVTS